jgi:dienelactone hydrolase
VPNPHPPTLRLAVALVTVAALVGVTACGSRESSSASSSSVTPTTREPLPVDFSQPGPYKVGTITVPLGDRDAVIYYPADPDRPGVSNHIDSYSSAEAIPDALQESVPEQLVHTVSLDAYQGAKASAEGPFPVVIHSHGEGSYYLFQSRHFEQLASWGFVVAAPDHKERSLAGLVQPSTDATSPAADPDQDVTDLNDTWQALRDQNVKPNGPLMAAMNLDELAAEGDSVGGSTVVRFAENPAVKTFIVEAPILAIDGSPPAKPSMVITGDEDHIVGVDLVRKEFDWLVPPKTLVVLKHAGHNAYSDLCPPIRAQGGLSQVADPLPPSFRGVVTRSEDGCAPANLDPERGYALVNQVTIAQLRWVFKVDPDRANLDPAYLQRTFGDALASIEFVGP